MIVQVYQLREKSRALNIAIVKLTAAWADTVPYRPPR